MAAFICFCVDCFAFWTWFFFAEAASSVDSMLESDFHLTYSNPSFLHRLLIIYQYVPLPLCAPKNIMRKVLKHLYRPSGYKAEFNCVCSCIKYFWFCCKWIGATRCYLNQTTDIIPWMFLSPQGKSWGADCLWMCLVVKYPYTGHLQ